MCFLPRVIVAVALVAGACSSEITGIPFDEPELDAGLVASEGSLQLSLTNKVRVEERPEGRVLVVRGHANQELANVFSFIPDDAFGQARLTGARRFEIVLADGPEANSILSGMPLLLAIQPTAGGPQLTARISIEPRFLRFSGSTQLFIESDVRPVYVRDDASSLRYRGTVFVPGETASLSVTTESGFDPVVSRVGAERFRFDWEYSPFLSAARQEDDTLYASALLVDGSAADKTAHLAIFVSELRLTTEDPYAVWPAPSCEPAVYRCVQEAEGAADLGHCGDYRAVLRCLSADACEVEGPEPLQLSPADTSALVPAFDAFNLGCGTGGSWCGLGALHGYQLPNCPEEQASIDAVLPLLAEAEPDAVLDPALGSFVDRATLEGTVFFQDGYSTHGDELLLALDELAGSNEAEGWEYIEEVPCHNCSAFIHRLAVLYPEAGWLFSIEGAFGYDS